MGVNPQFSLVFMIHTNGQWNTLTCKRDEGEPRSGHCCQMRERDGKEKAQNTLRWRQINAERTKTGK